MITGQNGILNMARRAADENKRAELIEEARRAIIEQIAENEGDNISKEQLYDILDKYFSGIPEVYADPATKEEENEAWANEFPKNFPTTGADGKLANPKEPYEDVENVTVYDIFTGEFGTGGDTTPGSTGSVSAGEVAEDVGEYIGSYVDYGVNLDENPETLDWRIFYAENGRIFLISADYVPTKHSAFDTVKSKAPLIVDTNAPELCFLWNVGSLTFSPIPETPADFLTIVKHTKYKLADHEESGGAKGVSQLLNKTAWAGFATGEGAEFAIGGPTIEMWCASWNAVLAYKGETEFVKIEVDEEKTTSEGDGYYLKSAGSDMTEPKSMSVIGRRGLTGEQLTKLETEYSTFWPHAVDYEEPSKPTVTANGETGESEGYLLASVGGDIAEGGQPETDMVWTQGTLGDEMVVDDRLSIRPVVCLKSGIKLVENAEKTEKGDKIYTIQYNN